VSPGQSCYTDGLAYFHLFEYWVRQTDSPTTNESEWARSVWSAPPGYSWGCEYINYLPLVVKDSQRMPVAGDRMMDENAKDRRRIHIGRPKCVQSMS